MNKRNKILVLLMVFGVIIALLGSTFAYLSWRSSTDQETVIDFSIGGDFSCAANGGGNLDEGDATLLPTYVNEESSANYIKREVKITPTINVEGQTIYMDLWLDIKELGEGLTNSQNLRYAFTTSSTSNTEGVVSTGNFYGKVAGDKINLLNGKDYADSNVDTYYLWIWLDAAQTDASTMNQAFKVSLNGSCSEGMSEGVFEVTSIKNTYQVVNVTAVNSSNKIVSYAITNTETQPVNNISDNIVASPLVNRNTDNGVTLLADSTSWIDIPESEQGKIYNLEYTVNNTGTYYFWFKDDTGKIINKSLNISKVDTTGPKCVWSNISKNNLDEGDSATISLLCTDSETGMVSKDLVVSDFTISNNIITISKVEKSNITNGYKYTLTVIGGSTSGETTITLPKDKLSDKVNNLNTETVSGTILVSTVKTYAITYKDVGDTEFSGVHGDNYPLTYTTGSTTTLVNPTKTGYTFAGWYTSSDGSGNTITKIDGSQAGELVLYAKWVANTYTIRYNGNGNTGGLTASSTHTYDTEKELTANGYIKDGYTFVGWNTKEDGTGTDYADKEVVKNLTSNNKGTIDLYAKWKVGTYTINYSDNMFSTTSQTTNGLTITYDSENSYLTINGTPTSSNVYISYIPNLSFTEGDKYTYKVTYVSGNFSNANNTNGVFSVDIKKSTNADLTSRNFVDNDYVTSGSSSKTFTVSSTGASEGSVLGYKLWFKTPSDWTFTNYKVKLEFTKVYNTKDVTYGSTYGELLKPEKVGYTFDGWYTEENGKGTKITSSDIVKITKDTTLYAKWTVNTYKVDFNGNMFSTASKTINGLTITYDYDNSYLTINGTPTSTTTILSSIQGLNFNENDVYTLSLEYISGSYSYTGTNFATLSADVIGENGNNLSTRNYVAKSYPTSGSTSGNLSITNLSSTSGTGLKFWMWANEPAKQTFTNYKIKVNLAKNNTKNVTYGSTYGALPIPKRIGFTFDGWYTGERGTGTKITSSDTVSITKDTTLYAKWIDNILPYGTASLSLTNGKYTLKLSNYGDDGSGLTGTYGFALTTNSNCSAATYTNQTGVSKDYTGSYTNGTTYYGCIKLTDKAGNIVYLSSVGVKYNLTTINKLYTTSGEQTYTVPTTGTYKLEVWGAQGGENGGYGGYSTGKVNLTSGEKIYINIGGLGVSKDSGSAYNGGGRGYATYATCGSGGGATHIAKVSGLLSTLSSKTSNILIVAGGGGGYCHDTTGGSGGGISGGGSNPGTQTSGNAFGVGAGVSSGCCMRGGGGGGYYGGSHSDNAPGSGGSGYIGNSLLTDKYMYCYNCTTSTATATKTNTTTNVSSTPTANYAKSGAGAAKITATITTNVTSLILTYNNNGGSGCYSKSIVKGGTYGALCTPVRDGYSFDGWYTAASDGTKITSSTGVTVTNNQTIYAHWTAITNPVITFNPDGNSSYVSGNISSTINVSKGSNNLDSSTLKYIYSKDKNTAPSVEFTPGSSYSLNTATGTYYLIAQACDVNGNCTKKVSNPFYVDNTKPTGSLALSEKDGIVEVNASTSDIDSGIKEYGYLITTDSSCPTTGYTTSNNTKYNFLVRESGTYLVCMKVTDNAGNSGIISNTITVEIIEIMYSLLSSSYSCSNSSAGTAPYVMTYTGECEVVDDGNGDWKVRFLTSGDLVFNSKTIIDTFLVGGGSGGSNLSGSNAWGGGAGGYTLTKRNDQIEVGTVYPIVVGSGGAVTAAGETSSAFGYKAAGGIAGNADTGHNGGSGGGGGRGSGGSNGSDGNLKSNTSGTVYEAGKGQMSLPGPNGETGNTREFGEETGTLYSGGGSGNSYGSNGGGEGGGGSAGVAGTANTGGGGGNNAAGGSGIVIIRNARESTAMSFNYDCDNVFYGFYDYYFTYTGNCEVIDDGNGDWRVKFLTSGDLVFHDSEAIDIFLVGGGSGGSNLSGSNAWGGGGGGYTRTEKRYSDIEVDTVYPIVIGAGGAVTAAGESSSAFGFTAAGGTAGNADTGHNGGSGGGGGRGSGGSNGSDGNLTTDSSGTVYGAGRGQISTPGPNGETGNTREFGEETGQLYAGGGGGAWGLAGGEGGGGAAMGGGYTGGSDGAANTGGGGGASHAGGSGIVIIRNAREGVALNFNYKCDNVHYGASNYYLTYTGNCEITNEGNNNWKIKFLSSGTLKFSGSAVIDTFLVGGGGGGGTGCYYYACGSGGGGGYTLTKKSITLTKNTGYQIVVGAGGDQLADGGSTTAFGFTAAGGYHGTSAGTAKPGNGGSGGGGSTQAGGSDGADSGGKGQISTPGPNGETGSTREFGESTGDLYSGGGGGAGYYHPTSGASVPGGAGGSGGGGAGANVYESSDEIGHNGLLNTGGGGGGSGYSAGGSGGSGTVIIRNAR